MTKVQRLDDYGFPVYKKGNFVYDIVVNGDDREYCNDFGGYIKNMLRCPLDTTCVDKDTECPIEIQIEHQKKQVTLENWL